MGKSVRHLAFNFAEEIKPKQNIQIMKTTLTTLSALLIAGIFLVSACKKKDDVIPDSPITTTGTTTGGTTGTQTAPTAVTPAISDADGVLIASNLNVTTAIPSTTITVTSVIGNAIASLYSATGGTVLVDGGTIKANDSTLVKQSNNAFIFNPKSADGISYSGSSRWSVSGNGTVPAFTYTAYGFPGTPTVNNVTSISKTANFTMTTASISSADSICFQITAGSKTIYKIKAGNQTSHTFTAAEMGTLDATSYGYLTITAYKFNNTTVSGKKYYFINLNTKNQSVSVN